MSETPKSSEAPKTVEFPINFARSPHYRSVHANGAWFGADPAGDLRMTFYNEYFPPPKKMVVLLDSQSRIVGEAEASRESIQGVIRELEVDIVLSYSAAVDFHKLLGENLEVMKQARQPKKEPVK